MIILQNMSWSNCFSYGEDNYIDFTANKLTQLVGVNGAGKSSIPAILSECYFNNNPKGTKKANILNRYSDAKSYSISSSFLKDKDTYTIKTTRGSTQKVTLLKNGEDISLHTATATYKLINDILGFKDISLIYQSSALSMEFLTSTDTKRKQFLIDLLNLTKYTKAFEVFKSLAKECSVELTKLETKRNTVQSWLDKHQKTPLIIEKLLEVPEYDYYAEQTEKTKLQNSLETITSTNKKITNNNQYKKILDNIELQVLPSEKPVSPDLLIKDKGGYEATKRAAKSTISKVSELKGECPTCLQTIDSERIVRITQENKAIIDEADLAIKTIDNTINKLNKELDEYNKAMKSIQEFEKYSSMFDPELDSALLDPDSLQTRVQEITNSINKQKEEIANIVQKNTLISKRNTEVEYIIAQSSEMVADLNITTAEIVTLSEKISKLDILKKAFSTNGLLAYKIECLVKNLEDLTNQYLSEFSSGRFVINFRVESDKLNVVIADNGIDVDIGDLSSGEKSRVNTSTLLAIRKLMQALASNRINLLILDEVAEHLDVDGKEKLVEVLNSEADLNTILISHSYQHPLLEKLMIVKENNISRIE
jgi:DNA repair exonuclease SbcCD ATPase subunit